MHDNNWSDLVKFIVASLAAILVRVLRDFVNRRYPGQSRRRKGESHRHPDRRSRPRNHQTHGDENE